MAATEAGTGRTDSRMTESGNVGDVGSKNSSLTPFLLGAGDAGKLLLWVAGELQGTVRMFYF
jgi:hypothetical protein